MTTISTALGAIALKMLGLAGDKHETTLMRIQDHIECRGKPKGNEGITLDRFTGT